MEELLNYLGVSFTISKFLPYLLNILIGIVFSILIHKHISASKYIRIIVIILITALPFGIYFSIYPIF